MELTREQYLWVWLLRLVAAGVIIAILVYWIRGWIDEHFK